MKMLGNLGFVFIFACAALAGFFPVASRAAPGDTDSTFSPPALDGSIYATAVQPDGKIVMAGAFTGGITRLESDGTTDPSFKPFAFDSSVLSVLIQPDGNGARDCRTSVGYGISRRGRYQSPEFSSCEDDGNLCSELRRDTFCFEQKNHIHRPLHRPDRRDGRADRPVSKVSGYCEMRSLLCSRVPSTDGAHGSAHMCLPEHLSLT